MTETARVQCVFLDVVGFTSNRSVEAQADVIAELNGIVRESIASLKISTKRIVILPTGDGMAIALLNQSVMDLHLSLAIRILKVLDDLNKNQSDDMRKFNVRIGINENIDNVVIDINKKRNIAGDGISFAQRIMDIADANQILVSSTVYETLRHREQYLNKFQHFTARVKHGLQMQVYQFVSPDITGLNSSTPSAFSAKSTKSPKFTQQVAYFVAHALRNQSFFLLLKGDSMRDDYAVILLTVLARDSETAACTPEHEEAYIFAWNNGTATIEELYKHYSEMDGWPAMWLADCLEEKILGPYSEFFEDRDGGMQKCYCIVKPSARDKLLREWPDIVKEMGV